MQFGMSDFQRVTAVLIVCRLSPNTSRPHDPASYERDACHEQDCFGPRQ